jgi:hypothetical protein
MQICITGDKHDELDPCPEGKTQLFSAHLIHETHYLLFDVAITHIVLTCTSFYACIIMVRRPQVPGLELMTPTPTLLPHLPTPIMTPTPAHPSPRFADAPVEDLGAAGPHRHQPQT